MRWQCYPFHHYAVRAPEVFPSLQERGLESFIGPHTFVERGTVRTSSGLCICIIIELNSVYLSEWVYWLSRFTKVIIEVYLDEERGHSAKHYSQSWYCCCLMHKISK